MIQYYQEATDMSSGRNLQPTPSYYLPNQPDNVVVFLLAGSFEYDLELIKRMPPPRNNYKNIIIPYSLSGKVGPNNFKYSISHSEYSDRLKYLQKQKMIPQLIVVKPPINKNSKENVYIPISNVIRELNKTYRGLSVDYIQTNIMNMMSQFMQMFPSTKKKIWVVDANRWKIYYGDNPNIGKSDLINGVLSACINGGNTQKLSQDTIIIFRDGNTDYKMDLRSDVSNADGIQKMCSRIGNEFHATLDTHSSDEDIDDMLSDLTGEPEEDENTKSNELKNNIRSLRDKFGVRELIRRKNHLYDAKAFAINAQLIHRLTPDAEPLEDYKHISDTLAIGDNPVEKSIIDDATKELGSRRLSNDADVMNTITSTRELKLRSNVGQIQLQKLDLQSLSSVTDIPIPAPIRPVKITTTNPASMRGSAYPTISKTYEKEMMDQDIIATFMNLQKLPDGFIVTGIDISNVSTPLTMANQWVIHLKNKKSGTQQSVKLFVPIVQNSRFLHNGTYYTIGKQDFPIPCLKIHQKLIMLTSNYNKISVSRYDTKSLVDLTQMVKAVSSVNQPDGTNPYVKVGSSSMTNSKYVSTVEYDEYAKRWFSFENPDLDCRIIFNRDQCLREFGFVTVDEDEFCIGMINDVPIVLNTDTGLDRNERSITEILLTVLPDHIRAAYNKAKPTKISMYAEIKIGVKIPLGVAIAAWEGISSLLKRSNCKYHFMNGREDTTGYLVFKFKDRTLMVQATIPNQLIFNGLYRIDTKSIPFDEFDKPIMDPNSIWVDVCNNQFFKQYSQLTTFITMYQFFMDVITEDVCRHYHLPDNICDLLIYAANMLSDNNFTSEMNSALYRVRSSEVIPAIIHCILAHAISRYNNSVGSKTKENKLVVNPNELFQTLESIENVTTRSALNPMVELHEGEVISYKGFHGVNKPRAYTKAKRSYEHSMIGKIAMSSPNSANVGINHQLTIDPKIESVRGYTSSQGPDAQYNDLQLASFSELLTPGTVSRDDAIRNAIATSQTSHIVQTADAEPVLCSNGLDEIVASYLSSEFAVTAEEDGQVLEISDGYMIVQYKSGHKRAIPVMDRYSFNSGSGFYVNNKLLTNFEVGDKFVKNDILAYHEKFFSKDSAGIVRLNLGPLAKIAFCGLYSTYEDAGLMTAKMSKRLATNVTMMQAAKLEAIENIEQIVHIGDEVEIGDPLIVFGLGDTGDKSVDNFLQAFQTDSGASLIDTAKRVFKSKHAGKIVDIRMYTIKSMDKLSPSLFNILDEHFKENVRKRKILDKHDKSDSVYKLDTLYTLPTQPLSGSSIKGINTDVLIEFYIAHDDEVSVGDKCVVYAASKQVISEVIPEGLEPYAESTPDEEISMFVAPQSVLKRMIPSVIMCSSANKVLVELKKRISSIWNENS